MSKIDDLLARLCPEGVEFMAIGKVITFLRTGLNPRQNFQLNTPGSTNYYITVRELRGFNLIVSDKTNLVNARGLALIQKRSKLMVGDILISGTGTIGRTALVTSEPKDWNIKEGIYALTPIPKLINARFLIYLFHSMNIRKQLLSRADGSTVASISMATLREIHIPVPPLAVQQEIVKVLDTFTKLEAELEAELEARTRQYQHYSEALLSFGESVKWKELVDLCTMITDGSHFSPPAVEAGYDMASVKDMQHNRFDFTACKKISSENFGVLVRNGCKPQLNDVLIAKDGSMLKHSFSIKEEVDVVVLSSIAILRPRLDIINPDYLAHYFRQNSFRKKAIRDFSSKGGVPRIVLKNFKRIKIPIPPLAEQARIVAILDKFDALVNGLSSGLPAEIEARKKQYEYYRNCLLSFKEAL